MNNKKGGVGAKILLVLILMIASAVGGAYGYRVLDGKMAVRDAMKNLESIRVSDYDTAEASTLEGLIDTAKKDLETATTRKEVYEILGNFTIDASKIKTKTEKELEEARREAEEARNSNKNNNNNNSNNYNYNNDYDNDNYDSSDDYNSNDSSNGNYNNNNNNSNSNNSSGSGSSDAITNDDGSSGRSSILGGLFGSNNDDN